MSTEDIKRVQKVCLNIGDERRMVFTLIFDTGMRLTEPLRLGWAILLFNTYSNEFNYKGNSISAGFNKWLKQYVHNSVIPSFRHSFRDGLRNAGVQSEMIDQLGGWLRQTVGQGYGKDSYLLILFN